VTVITAGVVEETIGAADVWLRGSRGPARKLVGDVDQRFIDSDHVAAVSAPRADFAHVFVFASFHLFTGSRPASASATAERRTAPW
jgi:hypothetical protein